MRIEQMRNRFPVLEQQTFLNHAATAPVSYATIKEMKNLCQQMCQPIDTYYHKWMALIKEARFLIAEILGCSLETIALTSSTSTSLNIVARCLQLEEGDQILVPFDEFPSNRYVWQNLQTQGVSCTFFNLPNQASLIETLEKQNLKKVRLISISLVNYRTGRKQDLQTFGKFCRSHGIISCVDAIQGVGTFPINLEETEIDFLAGGGQKWLLGPVGCGYLYIRKELITKVKVPLVSWSNVKFPEKFDTEKLEFANSAIRFESSFPNIVTVGGLCASLRELKKVGWHNIYRGIDYNISYLIERVSPFFSFPYTLGALVPLELGLKTNMSQVVELLTQRHISVTVRNQSIRISPHFYNNQEDIDCLLDTIKRWL